MKPFHWSTIPPSDLPHTLWESHTDDAVHLDTKALEANFCSASVKKGGGEGVVGAADPQAMMAAALGGKGGKKETVELIDSKRSYQVNIGLARFKMPYPAIRDALYAMDAAVLDEEKLASLAKLAPTAEEIEAVVDWSGEGELGATEQFFRVVSEVPHVASRVDLFLFKLRFDAVVEEVDAQLSACEKVVHRVRHCKQLHALMEVVLKLGNFLNGGTAKGGAWGFKLDTLNKLKNTKASDGQLTLLHYLITLLQTDPQHRQLHTFLDDLSGLHSATRVEWTMLQGEVNKIKSSHGRLKAELAACPQTAKDRFHRVMTEFEGVLKVKANSLGERMAALDRDVQEAVRWYGEEGGGMKMEDLLKTFDTFVEDWKEAEAWLEARKLQAEKDAKAALEKERRERERAALHIEKQLQGGASPSKKPVNKDQLVDSVMEQLNGSSSEELMKAVRLRRKAAAVEVDEGGGFDGSKLSMGGKQGMVNALLGRRSGGEKGNTLRLSGGEKGNTLRMSGGVATLGFNPLKGK